jgi:hypothetical protein
VKLLEAESKFVVFYPQVYKRDLFSVYPSLAKYCDTGAFADEFLRSQVYE